MHIPKISDSKIPHDHKCKLGMLLRKQRNNMGMPLSEVANYLSVNMATISRWESGNIPFKQVRSVLRLLLWYGIDPLEFFELKKPYF